MNDSQNPDLEWFYYVETVLSELCIGGNDIDISAVLKANSIGEYEKGINLEVFTTKLLALATGDHVTFHFKAYTFWPMLFVALFQTPSCFTYCDDQLTSLAAIMELAKMGRQGRLSTSREVRCRITYAPITKYHTVPWIVRYLGICLKDFTVN